MQNEHERWKKEKAFHASNGVVGIIWLQSLQTTISSLCQFEINHFKCVYMYSSFLTCTYLYMYIYRHHPHISSPLHHIVSKSFFLLSIYPLFKLHSQFLHDFLFFFFVKMNWFSYNSKSLNQYMFVINYFFINLSIYSKDLLS